MRIRADGKTYTLGGMLTVSRRTVFDGVNNTSDRCKISGGRSWSPMSLHFVSARRTDNVGVCVCVWGGGGGGGRWMAYLYKTYMPYLTL